MEDLIDELGIQAARIYKWHAGGKMKQKSLLLLKNMWKSKNSNSSRKQNYAVSRPRVPKLVCKEGLKVKLKEGLK
jgi:hypothetical protein